MVRPDSVECFPRLDVVPRLIKPSIGLDAKHSAYIMDTRSVLDGLFITGN